MSVAVFFFLILVIILDIKGKINITNRFLMYFWLVINPHFVLIFHYMLYFGVSRMYLLTVALLFAYVFAKVNILPFRKKAYISIRLTILQGGRRLLCYGFYAQAVQLAGYYIVISRYGWQSLPYIWFDLIMTVMYIWTLAINGSIRVILTGKWLGVIKRVVNMVLLHFPMVNFFVMIYLAKTAHLEYEYESFKIGYKYITQSDDTCMTKYPLVLIHGVGFRDLKYFNYWGRIPNELTRLGATVYYGHQQAWGTIDSNANEIKKKIEDILEKTGCEKVNIIAHSKGGLDSRYAISCLGLEDCVASLTTISTPHRGVKMADQLLKIIPNWLFNSICAFVNSFFGGIGDTNPDFATVVHSFTQKESKEFNERVQNSSKVYYQSYTSVIKNIFSDYILLIPYIYIRLIDGKNDGLVTVESAKWGEFRGVFTNKYRRGISHGDVIDLKREDYRGFDVVETYVKIVSDLKNKGF